MPKRKLPKNEIIAELYDSGMSTGEIAELFGVVPCAVCGLLKRMGHKMRSAKEAAAITRSSGRLKTTRYWLGKKQPPEMVEKRASKIRGEAHYLWKGGKDPRRYRSVVEKTSCAKCGTTSNLGIHHVDLDHFNNSPDNLEVLCVSCHMALHKKAYWDAYHAGDAAPKSNGPVGWRHADKDASRA